MIQKYIIGKPFNTEAVVTDIAPSAAPIPFFDSPEDGIFHLTLDPEDIVYGLGEQIRGINKRGWQYVNWNYDNPNHQEDTRSLYGSHNFLIVGGSKHRPTFGAFFDFPGKIVFDIGYTCYSEMKIQVKMDSPEECGLALYIITPEDSSLPEAYDISKQFRSIIGRSYIPPMWAFGYGQSRWGYRDEADIRKVAASYQAAGIPLDSIYMDIDYMEDYKDFTVSKERFTDLQAFSAEMLSQGIHLVPIIDAGVKIEPGYDIYEEGVAGDFFCKNAEGTDFVGAVWPGKVHFPDFLNPAARKWFGMKYERLTSQGIQGFWNDMNEPAIFYTEDRLADTLSHIEDLTSENMGINEYFAFTGMVGGLNGNEGDYSKFYHNVDGKLMRHDILHNLYGMNMTRSAYEALQTIEPDKRTLFFSRSSYIGAHRYGGIWQGDNKSWWSHILQSMQQLPALNMAGFLFVGSDTGGFGADTTEDLMMRYLQYSLFTPLMRNHAALGTREQELYQFSTVNALGEMIRIRYTLIPYLYSEFMKSALGNDLMFRPLSFVYESDQQALQVEDQLLLGNELMITPIYKQNARGRYVYLPEEMMLVRMRSPEDYDTQILPAGHHYVAAELTELIFFIRKGKKLPLVAPCNSTDKIDLQTLHYLGYPDGTYELYTDDGISALKE